MKICPKIMSEAVKYFKKIGTITPAYLMRKYKIDYVYGLKICLQIEERFPILWKNRHQNMLKKMRS